MKLVCLALEKALRSRIRKDAENFWDDARFQFQDHYGIHEEIDAGCDSLRRIWQELDGFVSQREEVDNIDSDTEANIEKLVQSLTDYEQKMPVWVQQARDDGMCRFQQYSAAFFQKAFNMVMAASSAPMKRRVFPALAKAVSLVNDESLHQNIEDVLLVVTSEGTKDEITSLCSAVKTPQLRPSSERSTH